jgi:hypothetical protein
MKRFAPQTLPVELPAQDKILGFIEKNLSFLFILFLFLF